MARAKQNPYMHIIGGLYVEALSADTMRIVKTYNSGWPENRTVFDAVIDRKQIHSLESFITAHYVDDYTPDDDPQVLSPQYLQTGNDDFPDSYPANIDKFVKVTKYPGEPKPQFHLLVHGVPLATIMHGLKYGLDQYAEGMTVKIDIASMSQADGNGLLFSQQIQEERKLPAGLKHYTGSEAFLAEWSDGQAGDIDQGIKVINTVSQLLPILSEAYSKLNAAKLSAIHDRLPDIYKVADWDKKKLAEKRSELASHAILAAVSGVIHAEQMLGEGNNDGGGDAEKKDSE